MLVMREIGAQLPIFLICQSTCLKEILDLMSVFNG
jgi:hypothetical protein